MTADDDAQPDPVERPREDTVRTHWTTARGSRPLPRSPLNEGRFGWLFRGLPAAPQLDADRLRALAASMREPDEAQPPGGWSSGGSNADQGDNTTLPSGYTYFGQFVDHDITFDPQSQLDRVNDPEALVDFRTPRFDLDSVYGSGPLDEPFQYEPDGTRLIVHQRDDGTIDLPRNLRGTALIGDPRNDENLIVSGLQLVFLRLHNRFVRQLDDEDYAGPLSRFDEAQRRTRWHYQWVVVNDFLRRISHPETLKRVLKDRSDGTFDIDRRFYRPKTRPYMPVEFSVAAYRYGHSQVRAAYDLNPGVLGKPVFLPGDAVPPEADLRGFRPLPAGWNVTWSLLLDMGTGTPPQPSRKIDTMLAGSLFSLPASGGSLPERNLQRSQALGLPSGQDVARRLRVPVLGDGDLTEAPAPTPLWFYVLREADRLSGGERLGPVGTMIVAEVLLGLLETDPQSFWRVDPTWKPVPPAAPAPAQFTLADLVRFAES